MPTKPNSQRTVVELREYESALVNCTQSTAASIAHDGHVRISPAGGLDCYELHARSKVGILLYPGLEIRIVPKVPVSRLLYLACHANGYEDGWKEVEALLDSVNDPLSAVAHALVFHTERALRPTPLKGYVTHEAAEMRVRGRLLFDRQISSRAGVLLPAELRFDEFELGIDENRVLKAALLIVNRFVQDRYLSARLRHSISALDGVVPWQVGKPVPDFTFNRLNERYRGSLRLAKLVLDRQSIEYPDRHTSGTAFLFNMNTVFEAYLGSAVREVIEAKYGGRIHEQYPLTLDKGDSLKMNPDILWIRAGLPLAVIDAKYKLVKNDNYPNADAYQMLAYCTRLGLRRGFLVYADLSGGTRSAATIRNAGIELHTTSICLDGSIDDLKASVDDVVQLVSRDI